MRNFVTWSYNTVRSLWDVVETKGQPEYLAYNMLVVEQDGGVGYYPGGFQNNLTTVFVKPRHVRHDFQDLYEYQRNRR